MSRDPLEELFGPLDSDDAETGAVETAANDDATTAATRAFEPAPAVPKRTQASPEPAPRAVPHEAAPTAATAAIGTAQRAAATPAPAPVRPRIQAPEPVSPRARAQRSAPDDLQTRPVPAGGKRSVAALPWIIVGAVAAIALVGSLIVVNALRGDEAKPEPTSEAPAPQPSDTEEPETEAPEPTTEKPVTDEAPKVDVGPNPIHMEISYANISVDSSQKLTRPQWQYIAGPPVRVMFESGLMNSFPDSCAAMRSPELQSPWGIEQGEDGKWTVVRPAGTCAADPELYDEVWGLMQAVADSVKPL
ncbi:hypothetical protein ACFSWE_09360 [Leucobacter albus]|uniref:Uncharacterized protein n=1 Tax=Leucobacter albus TaxID=272210 RepID=A0ABW3TRL7_9MICO